jgi:subtilisin family serine protease
MKKKFILFLIISSLFCSAQKNANSDLILSTGIIKLSPNFDSKLSSKVEPTEIFDGNYYRYIQFTSLPSENDKVNLEKLGVKLLMYLPYNTYIATIKQDCDFHLLNSFNISGIHEIISEYKLLRELSDALNQNNFPPHTIKGDKVGVSFTSYSNISFESVKSYLISNNINYSYENKFMNWFVVWINKNEVLNFVSKPFVCSAELVDDLPEEENNVGRTNHRSNVLFTDYNGGRKFNGAGIKVMLQDDGIIGPHVDYHNRVLNQFMTNNTGTHGDHCAGIIMGAGNKDPLTRGMAWGAGLYTFNASPSYPGFDSINNQYGSLGIRIISTSYSDGCNAGYTTRAQQLDIQNQLMPQLIHVFSGGNSGTSNCNYGAGAGWGNVTGGHKHSKNSIAVANLTHLDVVNSSSSKGPAHDGRLKPEISAVGTNVYSTINTDNYVSQTGTSMSCPAIAGIFAQMYQAYNLYNSNNNPPSALMKAIILNTADDIGNPGPDFRHGYGRVNALKAVKAIEQVNYASGSISNGGLSTHTINVPPGVKQMKVMTYWHDYQAAINASIALVNNLNTTLINPASVVFNPLILDFTPNVTALNSNATPGIDMRNNHEQITINLPISGIYTLNVNGFSVPMGPQTYYSTWIFEMDGYTVTYPIGGEGFVPNEFEVIRWDNIESVGTQTLEYTTDNGTSWTTISNSIPGSQRYLNWAVPNTISGQCKVRISRGSFSATSDTTFSIINLPSNLTVAWACTDSVKLNWNAAAGATSYDIFKLGSLFMDSVGTSTTTSFVIQNTPSSQTHWFSVRSRGPQSAVGRRAIAIKKTPGTFSCPLTVTDITKSNSFGKPISVYPNPSEGIYNVEISQLINTDISYKIFDISGKIIQQSIFGKQSNDFFTSVNLSEFPTGIYTLAINVGENTHRVKLCKL